MRGIAGVGAAKLATGANNSNTSSSSLSSLFASEMWDMLPTCEDEELAYFEAFREWRARGEGESLEGVIGEFLTGVEPVIVLSLAERVSADFRVEPLGVRGVKELDKEEAEEEGLTTDDAADAVAVFKTFAGRVGDDLRLLAEGVVGGLILLDGVDGVAGGVEFTAEDAFNAAR
jgi:hypothetical protein